MGRSHRLTCAHSLPLPMDSCEVEEALPETQGPCLDWGPHVATEELGTPSKLMNLSGSWFPNPKLVGWSTWALLPSHFLILLFLVPLGSGHLVLSSLPSLSHSTPLLSFLSMWSWWGSNYIAFLNEGRGQGLSLANQTLGQITGWQLWKGPAVVPRPSCPGSCPSCAEVSISSLILQTLQCGSNKIPFSSGPMSGAYTSWPWWFPVRILNPGSESDCRWHRSTCQWSCLPAGEIFNKQEMTWLSFIVFFLSNWESPWEHGIYINVLCISY